MPEFYASAIQNTESALCDELRELGFRSVRLNRGGIPFRGEWSEGWRACLESRIAQRILVVMGRNPVSDADQLYEAAREIPWTDYLTSQQTLSVNCVAVGSALRHSGFVALRVKDAIVDQVRDLEGERPSIDREDPDVRVFVYLANNKATFYLDMSGQPLHLRGYREKSGDAPLRENLAAAILRMSGWDQKTPLIDPMCGSGTLAIEAAQWAARLAPGLSRDRFGFERWNNFDEEMMQSLQSDGPARTLVTNPPYGKRLSSDDEFLGKMGAVIRRLHGWRVAILSGSSNIERAIKIPPINSIPLVNGDLDCQLLIYQID